MTDLTHRDLLPHYPKTPLALPEKWLWSIDPQDGRWVALRIVKPGENFGRMTSRQKGDVYIRVHEASWPPQDDMLRITVRIDGVEHTNPKNHFEQIVFSQAPFKVYQAVYEANKLLDAYNEGIMNQ